MIQQMINAPRHTYLPTILIRYTKSPAFAANLSPKSSTVTFGTSIAIQEIIKEYQRQKTNQRSRKGGSARKPQQYHAEAEVII